MKQLYSKTLALLITLIGSTGIFAQNITSFAPIIGPVGTSVIISGSGFSTTPSLNTVYFDNAKANVTGATASSLTVTVPYGSSSNAEIKVTRGGIQRSSANMVSGVRTFKVNFSGGTMLPTNYQTQSINLYGASKAVASGYLNNDGFPDIAVMVDYGGSNDSLKIYTGNGTGGYTMTSKVLVGMISDAAISLADIDNDGDIDVAASIYTSASDIKFFTNNGSGVMTAGNIVSAGYCLSLVPGDLNGDGWVDFVASSGNWYINKLMNNQNGTFTSSQINSNGAEAVVVADFNNNGALDIVASRFGSTQYEVYLGSGTGGFTSQGVVAAACPIGKIVAGDFNQDAKPDICYSSYTNNMIVTAISNGDGTFMAPTTVAATNARDVRIGDFDGDGFIDVESQIYTGGTPGFYLFKGSSPGTLSAPVTIPGSTSITGHCSASVSDFNVDGKPDLVTANSGSNTMQIQYYKTPLSVTIPTSTNVTCNLGTNGSATTNVVGGFTPYTYSWTGGSTVANPTNLTAGTKTVTVTDAMGGTATATVTITQPTAITTGIASQTNVNCFGQSTGAVTLTAPTGGNSPYTYSWAPSGGTAISISARPAGTYTCTVTDNVGCTKTQTVTITQPAAPLGASATTTSVTCFGASTGSATVTPTGGTTPYTYVWSPASGTLASISGKTAGAYTCTITDNKGCTFPQALTITQPAAPVSGTISSTGVLCNGGSTGSATVTAVGGTGAYTYSWAPSGGTAATTTGRPAGTYTCTINDVNSCTATQTVTITQPAVLSATYSQTNVLCNGGSTGTATVTPSGGTSPYTYNWLPGGATTQTRTGLAQGNYTCNVQDANACNTAVVVSITQPGVLTNSTTQTNVSCFGMNNGTSTVTGISGTAPYTYSWAPSGGTASTASSLAPNTYTCSVTDANGCIKTQTVTITQPAVLNSSATQTNVSCLGGSNGSATVTPTGGTTPYTYTWTPGTGSAATKTGLNAGTHTCTVTDNNGCVSSQTVTITQPSGISIGETVHTDVSCFGGTNGASTISVSGGTGPYTYTWTPSGGNTASITGRSAGSYTCNITDANGCTGNIFTVITQPTVLGSSISASSNVSCNGGTNGSATVSVTGGTAPYTYSWAPSGGTAASITSMPAATYTCTITDFNGCVKTQTITISEPTLLNSSITASSNVTCNGGANGSATVTATGGTAPYTYSWAPSGGTAASITGAIAGTYTCTITDFNGCVKTQTVTLTQPTAVSISFSTNNSTCGGTNGSATATPTGGSGSGYTYQWNAAAANQTTATAINLAAGSYGIVITDGTGCTGSNTASVSNTGGPSLTTSGTDINCFGSCTGTADANATGGSLPYTYQWSASAGNQTTQTATALCAGTHTVTVTDNVGCSIIGTRVVTQPTAVGSSFTTTNVNCNGTSTGSTTIIASGGTPGYTYSWAPLGGTGVTASSLPANTYTCTVTDANSCASTHTVTITQPTALSATNTKTDVTCNGTLTGTATAIPAGGTAPYTYSWAPSGGTAATATGLGFGTYTCTVTDNNTCVTTTTLTITQPSVLSSGTSQLNVSCNGLNNGSATVTPAGGTAPYSYSWSPAGGSSTTASGLSPTAYTCTITDNNGCSINRSFTITQPALLTASIVSQTNVNCNGNSTGSATASAGGGTAPYTYNWTPTGGTAATTTAKPAGTYTCTINDNNSCVTTTTVSITEPAVLTATNTQTDVNCFGASTGSATVTASGGTTAYTYSWAPSGGTAATASGLTATNYTCTITDANSCVTTSTVSIAQPAALSATNTFLNVSCNGGNDGSATVTAAGGTLPYTYNWTPSGGTAVTANNLTAGNYTCTITDNNACVTTSTVSISEPAALTVSSTQTNVSCNGGTNGTATVTVGGGTPAYTYSWSSGGTTAIETGLSPATYTCTITDANSCVTNTIVTITEPTALSSSTSGSNVLCFNGNTGTAAIAVNGGTPAYTYNWLPSGGTASAASGLIAGTYTCDVTDANGCTHSNTILISEPSAFTTTSTSTDISCNGGNNGSATVIPSGGTAGYTYAWLPSGGTTATESGLIAGTYTVNLTDANGCFTSNTITVNQPSVISSSTTGTNTNCNAGSDGTATISVSGGTPTYTYSWSSGGTSSTESGLAAGTYTCIATDANGCTHSDTYTVGEPSAFFVNVNQLSSAGCAGGTAGSAQIIVTGGTAPYNYVWSSGGTTDTETGLSAQTYTCNFTDNNGCVGSGNISITTDPYKDLYGALTFPGGTIISGYAFAFKQQSSLNGIDTVAIVPITGGPSANYLFTSLIADNYFVKVILDSILHPTAVPTYYGNVFQWDSSLVVAHGCAATDTANINVIQTLPGSGTGFISGFVIEGNGFGGLRINNGGNQPNLPFAPGGPLKGVDVKLGKNPGGGIQARTTSDSSGYYHFDSIPDGSYNIYVDIPNLPMDSLRNVTLAPGSDTSLLNNYYADSLRIFIDTAQSIGIYSSVKNYDNHFGIYPNPTTGVMNLQFSIPNESQKANIVISDALGREIYSSGQQQYIKGEQTVSLNASVLNLKPGVYFVSMITGGIIHTQRIVVIE